MPDSNITKRALANAMKTLMGEKAFAKISVGDICELCGMNRKSFYYHFRDKYELVNWIYSTEFIETVSEKNYDDSWDFLYDTCAYFYENRVFYVNAFEVTGQDSFREYYGNLFRSILESAIEDEFTDSKHQRFYAVFFADAFLVGIERWLRENALSAEEFVTLVRQGMQGVAARVIRQMDQDSPDRGPASHAP